MQTDATLEQVKLLAKQLKIPTFARYPDLIRQMDGTTDFGKLLLSLMENEYEQRQENQNRRRLKQAGLPYTKTLEELDLSGNQIPAVSGLKKIQTLKKLDLSGNPLAEGQLEELKEALPDCVIVYP